MNIDNVKLALQDLRDKAIEAHASSDGPKVNHLCSVALDFVFTTQPNLNLHEVRWVFILSAYWTTNAIILDRVTRNEPIVGQLFGQETNQPQVKLLAFVTKTLQTLKLPDFPDLRSGDGEVVDETLDEDYPLYELAFELFWFFSKGSDRWRKAICETIEHLPEREKQLSDLLVRVRDRLEFQNSILTGEKIDDFDFRSSRRAWLGKGWQIYFLQNVSYSLL